MKGLLLAGGHGTRLRPLTYTGNKHMLPVANKPILLYGLEQLRDAGITEIGIILGPIKEGIEEAIGDGSKFGVKVTYINQPEPRGIAHAVGISEDFIGDGPFVVYLGDNLLKKGIKPFVKEFQRENWDELLLLSKIEDLAKRKRFGVAHIKNNKIIRVIEKPEKPEEISSDLVMIGVYMFRPKIFEAIKQLKPSWRNELEITDAIQKLIDWGCKVAPRVTQGWWKDTGAPEDILEANRLVLDELKPEVKGKIENKSSIQGRVTVEENALIKEGALI
ncbi:MAG: glucose-1-phosphate thymidylyltransferase, partial [Candidatus Bathyarchaeia archaeon]